jgi:serine/threonine protein kinase
MSQGNESSSGSGDASELAERAWELIADRLDRFAAAWAASLDGAEPLPDVRAFLSDADTVTARVLAIELVKVDVEHRWLNRREPRRLEWYVDQLPQLGPSHLLPDDLVYEEVQARVQSGDVVDEQDLRNRFPKQAPGVLKLLGGMSAPGSSSRTYDYATKMATSLPKQSRPSVAPYVHLKAGDVIDDFQLIAALGTGAFARVFLARQQSMERLVALKISPPVGSEPQTLAQLDHPHVVRVFDQRKSDEPPARLMYMEVVPGGTLADTLARCREANAAHPDGPMLLAAIDARLLAVGTLPPSGSSRRAWIEQHAWAEVVCRLGAELAEGLAYAHSRGVLHRDIKPANVLLTADATPKLADFNVSYNGGRADEDPADTFGGSLAYMSPEQLAACHPILGGSPQLVRDASDIYSLGILLWEMLTGQRPFRDENVSSSGGMLARLQRMIDARWAVSLEGLGALLPPDCPLSVRETLLRALHPNKAERYASAEEFARALRLCLNPRCWSLLRVPRGRLGKFALRYPILAVVLAGLIPNVIVAAFNFHYNKYRMEEYVQAKAGELAAASVQPLASEHVDALVAPYREQVYAAFDIVQKWVNGTAFPLGIAIGAWFAWKTLRMLRPDAPRSASVGSTQLLLFGRFVSRMLLVLWTVSGVAFPIALSWNISELRTTEFQVHFFVSLLLAGVAAIAYPFLLITAMVVRYFVPDQMRRGVIAGPRERVLEQLARLNRFHLALSALVPLLGVLLVVAFGSQQRWLLLAVSGGGLLGFVAMFVLEREIELDLRALRSVAVDERANAAWIQQAEDAQDPARRELGRPS